MLLLTNSTKVVQEALMAIPMAISKIMDLLSDSREVIRNDGLLLLTHLTKVRVNWCCYGVIAIFAFYLVIMGPCRAFNVLASKSI